MTSTISTMTPNTAGQRLANGASALGLAIPILANAWGGAPSAFDANNLILTMPSLRAPWRGTLETIPAWRFRDVSGEALAAPNATGRVAAFRMHSQAMQRLANRATARYAPGSARQPRALPWFMVIRNFDWDSTPFRCEAGDPLLLGATLSGPVSFHDDRGLIICPAAVAALFADLLSDPNNAAMRGPVVADGGSLATIAGIAPVGTVAHIVDPHGVPFVPVVGSLQQAQPNGTGAALATGALIAWQAGQTIGPNAAGASRIRIGLMDAGTLSAAPVACPPLPPGVLRQFLRLAAVDLPFYILGNRTFGEMQGIEPDDGKMPADLLPRVRDNVSITYLRDGLDTLNRAGAVAERVAGVGNSLFFIVSPRIEQQVGYALAPASDRWPQPLPPAATPQPIASPRPDIIAGLSAAWANEHDIVVTFAAGKLPAGAHVRIYPQQFQPIAEIGEALSFLRGDGGAATVPFQTPTPSVSLLLANPFALAPAQQRLPDPKLTIDIVLIDRMRTRAMWGAVTVSIAGPDATPPPDGFVLAGPQIVDQWPVWFRSTASSPLFGIKSAVAGSASTANDMVSIAKSLAVAAPPREGPRLPTMARFETIVATGIQGGAPSGALRWEGVLSGGHWARETRSDQHALGNPGHPAGPDIHAPGIHVTGALGYDLAVHALKRAMPILPMSNFPTSGDDVIAEVLGSPTSPPSWLLFLISPSMRPPVDAPAPGATGSGAVLTTIAAGTETPELSLLPAPQGPGPYTLANLVSDINNAIKPIPITINPPPPSPDADRAINDVRREMFIAHNGIRDAVWSLRRAIRQARELIYVEGPSFGPTAYDDDPAGFPDLIDDLAQSLAQHPGLKLVVAVARESDFDRAYQGYVRRTLMTRAAAVNALGNQFPGRVACFHPVGFPGRSAQLRTSCVVVDDVWSLVGTSHWRRRGMTFDGAVDVASFDRTFDQGYSVGVRRFRQTVMAAKLGITQPIPGGQPSPEWVRLSRPIGAFQLIADMLAQGGLGRIEPFWEGPTDDSVLPTDIRIVDPNGMSGLDGVLAIASFLNSHSAVP